MSLLADSCGALRTREQAVEAHAPLMTEKEVETMRTEHTQNRVRAIV